MMRGLVSRRLVPHESGILVRVVTTGICLVLVVPLVVIVGLAMNESRYLEFPPDEFSFSAMEAVLTSSEWRRAFEQSVAVAALSAPLATVLAAAAALGIRRMRFRRFAQTVMILPLIVPLIVTALAIYPVFNDFRLIGTTAGLVFAHTIVALPFAFLTIWASLSVLDPQLDRAAASLGANWFQAMRRITIPLITPAILASLVVAVAVSFDEIVLSLFVSSPTNRTVPVVLWSHLRENLGPEVAAASLFVVLVNLFILASAVLVARWSIRRRLRAA